LASLPVLEYVRRFSLGLLCSVARYPYGLLNGLIWPKDGYASIA
jgi:hypothetical protein